MNDLVGTLAGPMAGLGFGGVAGFAVGYAAKKVTKLAAIGLGLLFIAIQMLAYYGLVDVRWDAVQGSAEQIWQNGDGPTLAERAWEVLSYNLPFGGGFLAGFAIGFRRG